MKVTIVISVLNGSETLERCLLSCIRQTCNVELVVIDGLSVDGTVDILHRYSSKIAYWSSEKDNGIYHAWNKALDQATGDWICFLGCDDCWISEDSLRSMLDEADYPNINFVSSKMYMVDSLGSIVGSAGKPMNLKNVCSGIGIAHPGSLHHRSLFIQNGCFDISYRIAGDYEFLLRCNASLCPKFVDKYTILMGNGGCSNTRFSLTIREGVRALWKTPGFGKLPAIKLYIAAHLSISKVIIILFYERTQNLWKDSKENI